MGCAEEEAVGVEAVQQPAGRGDGAADAGRDVLHAGAVGHGRDDPQHLERARLTAPSLRIRLSTAFQRSVSCRTSAAKYSWALIRAPPSTPAAGAGTVRLALMLAM
ncbi:hypothetical protein MAFF212519_13470 [Clavibacter michiganensis]